MRRPSGFGARDHGRERGRQRIGAALGQRAAISFAGPCLTQLIEQSGAQQQPDKIERRQRQPAVDCGQCLRGSPG